MIHYSEGEWTLGEWEIYESQPWIYHNCPAGLSEKSNLPARTLHFRVDCPRCRERIPENFLMMFNAMLM